LRGCEAEKRRSGDERGKRNSQRAPAGRGHLESVTDPSSLSPRPKHRDERNHEPERE
jgi:hypothetical protein